MRDFNDKLVQSIDFTKVIIPQISTKVKIGGINVQDIERINKRVIQDIEYLRNIDRNTIQERFSLLNSYFKI